MRLLLPLLLLLPGLCSGRCPKQCTCALKSGRKVVECSGGGLTRIPVADMDANIHELLVSAPADHPNNITLGRLFLKFPNLDTVRVTGSGVPAIGDSSFWPGRRMRLLDLRNNAIGFLHESDFNGLKNLRDLDLSGNRISAAPSAPFRHLLNLRRLSLADNSLHSLVPRFFYLLSYLEELDISGNALGRLEPDDLQDVKSLRVLSAARCLLVELHPILYQQLPLLEELDLQGNRLAALAPAEFRHLPRLHTLRLDGNLLTALPDGAFHGHSLQELSLAANRIEAITDGTFANTSVRILDLSGNRIEYVLPDATRPLSASLVELNLDSNPLGDQAFSALVTPLKVLKRLRASDLLLKNLLPGTFDLCSDLRFANLSGNGLSELSPESLSPLVSLDEMDLRHNLFPHLSAVVLETLTNLTYFQQLHLAGNPFDCGSCRVGDLKRALNTSAFLNASECLLCRLPPKWSRKCLSDINALECRGGARYDRRQLARTSQVGLVVAVAIIAVIVVIIVAIIVVYRRHIAHYYTHEEEQRAWKGIYENPAMSPRAYTDGDKPTFIGAPDRVDDNIDDLRPMR